MLPALGMGSRYLARLGSSEVLQMRLRCAACGCYVQNNPYGQMYTAQYGKREHEVLVQPCKRCLSKQLHKYKRLILKVVLS